MGAVGSKTLKRSICFGNTHLANIAPKRIRNSLKGPNLGNCVEQRSLRPWLTNLAKYQSLARGARQKFDSTGVVNKKRKADGSIAVLLSLNSPQVPKWKTHPIV